MKWQGGDNAQFLHSRQTPSKIIVTEEEELYKQFCRQRYNKFLPYCFYTVKKIFIYIVIQFH